MEPPGKWVWDREEINVTKRAFKSIEQMKISSIAKQKFAMLANTGIIMYLELMHEKIFFGNDYSTFVFISLG